MPKRDDNGELRRFKMRKFIISLQPKVVRGIKSRKLRWAGYIARLKKGRSAFNIFNGEFYGNRLLGRPSSRWEANIIIDLK